MDDHGDMSEIEELKLKLRNLQEENQDDILRRIELLEGKTEAVSFYENYMSRLPDHVRSMVVAKFAVCETCGNGELIPPEEGD